MDSELADRMAALAVELGAQRQMLEAIMARLDQLPAAVVDEANRQASDAVLRRLDQFPPGTVPR